MGSGRWVRARGGWGWGLLVQEGGPASRDALPLLPPCCWRWQEWGVDLSRHQEPLPATLAYTDWVHAIATDPSVVSASPLPHHAHEPLPPPSPPRPRWSSPPRLSHASPVCLPAHPPAQGVASIMAAMVPCLRLYAFLGCQLSRAHPDQHQHPYSGALHCCVCVCWRRHLQHCTAPH